jgi:hypothetical protein
MISRPGILIIHEQNLNFILSENGLLLRVERPIRREDGSAVYSRITHRLQSCGTYNNTLMSNLRHPTWRANSPCLYHSLIFPDTEFFICRLLEHLTCRIMRYFGDSETSVPSPEGIEVCWILLHTWPHGCTGDRGRGEMLIWYWSSLLTSLCFVAVRKTHAIHSCRKHIGK